MRCQFLICRGNAFRTAFRKIGGLRALTVAPFVALSASATEQMIDTIKESLQLKHDSCHCQQEPGQA